MISHSVLRLELYGLAGITASQSPRQPITKTPNRYRHSRKSRDQKPEKVLNYINYKLIQLQEAFGLVEWCNIMGQSDPALLFISLHNRAVLQCNQLG
jgi:hypothetical protein